jgi:hypothetical protein
MYKSFYNNNIEINQQNEPADEEIDHENYAYLLNQSSASGKGQARFHSLGFHNKQSFFFFTVICFNKIASPLALTVNVLFKKWSDQISRSIFCNVGMFIQ